MPQVTPPAPNVLLDQRGDRIKENSRARVASPVRPRMIYAPWSDSEIAALKKWQALGFVHGFTCPHGHGALDAQRDFWMCTTCGYTQNWAHDFMCDETKHPKDPLSGLRYDAS